jgi:hypothetical protein
MSEIEIYKNVVINLIFNHILTIDPRNQINSTSCYAYINIPFIPDEVVLKNLSVHDGDTAAVSSEPMYLIKTDLINDNYIIHFPKTAAMHEIENIPFPLKKPISGLYKFSVVDIINTVPGNEATFEMFCTLTLIFIKYKNK